MKRGFTLIETLVAIFLLSLLLTGATALIQQALRISSKLKNDTTAVFLAQEGLELVRWQRDTNRLSGVGWLSGIHPGNPCGTGNGCTAELNPSTGDLSFNNCTGGGCPFLKFHAATKTYNYDSTGVDTIYRRTIKTSNVPASSQPEVLVQVIITWTTPFGSRSYTIEENLFDWQ